jgi:hypothetical protein
MSSSFDGQQYKSVRGPVDEFTVKQLPFVTVMSRPSTASSAHAVPAQLSKPRPSPTGTATPSSQQLSRPHTAATGTMSFAAPRAAQFSPKWTADKMRVAGAPSASSGTASAQPGRQRALPVPSEQKLLSKQNAGDYNHMMGEKTVRGEAAAGRRVPVRALLFEENSTLRAAVSALRTMIEHEKQLKEGIEREVDELQGRCAELEAAVEAGSCKGGDKAWRTNTKKLKNFGPLAPSSVTDPFAEEQRIIRERQQRLAEKEQRRREKLEQPGPAATNPLAATKFAATKMHA